jgi:succinate-acetate transporter protein
MMRVLFFLAAIMCFTGWAVSVFVYNAGELIHVLLAFTAIFCVLGVMGNEQHGPVSNPDLF